MVSLRIGPATSVTGTEGGKEALQGASFATQEDRPVIWLCAACQTHGPISEYFSVCCIKQTRQKFVGYVPRNTPDLALQHKIECIGLPPMLLGVTERKLHSPFKGRSPTR